MLQRLYHIIHLITVAVRSVQCMTVVCIFLCLSFIFKKLDKLLTLHSVSQIECLPAKKNLFIDQKHVVILNRSVSHYASMSTVTN